MASVIAVRFDWNVLSRSDLHIREVPINTNALPPIYQGEKYGVFGSSKPETIVATIMEITSGSNRTPASSGPSPYTMREFHDSLLAAKKHLHV